MFPLGIQLVLVSQISLQTWVSEWNNLGSWYLNISHIKTSSAFFSPSCVVVVSQLATSRDHSEVFQVHGEVLKPADWASIIWAGVLLVSEGWHLLSDDREGPEAWGLSSTHKSSLLWEVKQVHEKSNKGLCAILASLLLREENRAICSVSDSHTLHQAPTPLPQLCDLK